MLGNVTLAEGSLSKKETFFVLRYATFHISITTKNADATGAFKNVKMLIVEIHTELRKVTIAHHQIHALLFLYLPIKMQA